MNKKIKVGIVGCGVIGSELARACAGILEDRLELTALYDIDENKKNSLSEEFKKKLTVNSIDDVFDKSDLVIEAAGAKVAVPILQKAIETSKSVLIMSIGGLINSYDMLKRAKDKNIKVYLPSGAVCGIDGIKAAGIAGIEKVTLTTRKPPKGLKGAPYIEKKKIDLDNIKEETIIFEGSADEAVQGFPKNINVASLLCLAGIGAKKTKVRIVTSPEFTRNSHTVEVVGDFGRIVTQTDNVPSGSNPKTSMLAYFSAIATLKGITESVRIGT